tara:strand:+ start:2432 stop:2599 length:168 start_codon:yes stop_codon:yes gene_type:complete
MRKKQLNNEYDLLMLKADQAIGRKEVVRLLHRAASLRQKLSDPINRISSNEKLFL